MVRLGHNPGSGQAGFTLIEMVLVAVLLAVLSAIGIGRYANASCNYRADMAAKRVAADLARARTEAWSAGASRTVTFSASNNQYQMLGIRDMNTGSANSTIKLADPPYAATLVSASFQGTQNMSFDGYGRASNSGTVVVSAGSAQKIITVDAGSGAVRVP